MKRLAQEEIAYLKERLAKWQTPPAMHGLVEATMNSLGETNLFNQSGLSFLRDAWIAAQFGEGRNAEKARLVSDNWPDFELLMGGRVEHFEAVEADAPERRRGEEYRKEIRKADDPVEDWVARAEHAPAWLEAACRKKASKRYGGRTNLVIYLNLSEFGIRQSEVEASFRSETEAVKDTFESVWILWKNRPYQVWP